MKRCDLGDARLTTPQRADGGLCPGSDSGRITIAAENQAVSGQAGADHMTAAGELWMRCKSFSVNVLHSGVVCGRFRIEK